MPTMPVRPLLYHGCSHTPSARQGPVGPAGAPWGATPQGVWGPRGAALRRAPGRASGAAAAGGAPAGAAQKGRVFCLSARTWLVIV